jgi:Fe2+ or Zn2+ uptake regulation protein
MKKTAEKLEFKSLLQKSGLRATPSRLAVLDVLHRSKKPLSAQRVIEEVKDGMDQATVYRIFKDLLAKGLVRTIDLRHNHAHYELVRPDDHHHLICVKCGRIEDVHECGVEEMQAAVARRSKHFAAISNHSLEFYGLCKSCAKKDEE